MKHAPIRFKISIALLAASFYGPIAGAAVQADPDDAVPEGPKRPYHISRGDTLSQIAESLYGNWVKYKELWELNKDHISNPHWIYPGQRLRLLGGEEIELVEGAAANAEERAARRERDGLMSDSDLVASNGDTLPARPSRGGRQGRRGRSNEWQLLPLQSWEKFTFRLPPQIDPDGFDRRSRVGIHYKDTINLPATVTTDRLAIMGEITGGRTEFSAVGIGDQVLIRAEEELQVGSTYSVTSDPERIQSNRDKRVGYIYRLNGKIRIVGVRDGVFVGTVTQAYDRIQRDMLLINEVPQMRLVTEIPAPSALAASVVEDESPYSINLGAHRLIFLDVGTEDGIKPGMVFRRYQHEDPATGKTLSAQDFLVEAEAKILVASDRFSTAVVLNSRSLMFRNDELVAIVDVSDLGRHMGLQSDIQHKPSTGLDELDQMDTSQGLGETEDRELRQLENVGAGDDIQKIEVNSNPKSAVEIGREKGPNDGTGGIPAAPKVHSPTEPSDDLDKPTDTPVPDDTTPGSEPVPESPPVDEVQPEAPVPTTAPDPFATDAFKDGSGNKVEPAPVTESNPNPPQDPLLNAIPDSGGAPAETPGL